MKIRVTFLVLTAPELKLYSPIIDKALQENSVSISLIVKRNVPSKKKIAFNDNLNPFNKNKSVQIIDIASESEIYKTLNELRTDNLIVSCAPIKQLHEIKKYSKARVFYLQHSTDIISNWPHLPLASSINLFDGLFLFSKYWKKEFIHELAKNGKLSKAYLNEVQEKISVVGFPELDQIKNLDRDNVKEKYGLNPNKKIIFLDSLPIVKHIPNAFYKYYFSINGTWLNRIKQILINLTYDLFIEKTHVWKLPYYWYKIIFENKISRYEVIFDELREYCNRNNFLLICKSRKKNNDPDWLIEGCDLFKYDEGYYPFTLLELLYVSDAYIGFNSTSVIEGVYCNLHAKLLNVYPAEFQYGNYGGNVFQYLDRCTKETESWLNYKDVVRTILWNEKNQKDLSMFDTVLDNKDLNLYKAKFLGFDDGLSAERVLTRLIHYGR